MNKIAKFYFQPRQALIFAWAMMLLLPACSTTDNADLTASPPPPPLTEAQKAVLQEPFASFIQKLESDTGIKLVPIPAGTFVMGSSAEEIHRDGRRNEMPQTRVTLTKNFFMGSTDITQAQYEKVMGENPSFFKWGKDYPVEMVSWNNAMEFCRRLTKQELPLGILPEAYVFTLPTEAQWEYACRAGTTGWNKDNLGIIAWYQKNSDNRTHPVAQKQPNAWGLYDMLGNVGQWCLDGYGPYPGGEVTDPIGVSNGSWVVIRGGYFGYDAVDCCPAIRGENSRDYKAHGFGFRIILYQAL